MMRRDSRHRRGAAGVAVVISLVLLLSVAALAIDVGYVYNRCGEMQNAVDAGALAGASGLPIDDDEARTRAVDYAGQNRLGSESVVVDPSDVEIGNWEWNSKSFTPVTGTPAMTPNAVRVVGRKLGLPLFFATIMGFANADVEREAIALSDSGRCRGIWGLEGVTVSGDIITDSYDSRVGTYGSGNMGQHGDICSNEDIDLNGSVSIRGDAMYGAGYEIDISGSSYEIWGIVGDICCPVAPPIVDTSEASSNNDNDTIGLTDQGRDPWFGGGIRLVSSDNLTLSAGTYYFTSVRMTGQATLTITGPTAIYLDGDGKFTGGGLVNATQDPTNLVIYSIGNTLKLAGNAAFYGAVVAPDAEVTLAGTSDYFGTVIGETVKSVGDAVIHVDEAVIADLFGGDGELVPVLVR